MADAGGHGPRVGRRAAVLGGRREASKWSGRLRAVLSAAGEWLADALRSEADAARLAPWLAVGFGIGIIFYFAAPSEPSLYAPALACAAFSGVAWISRERPIAFALTIALLSITAGFAAGCLRGILVAHPVLTRPTGTVLLAGHVVARDATERSDRIVLRVTEKHGRGAEGVPPQVRVALRRGQAPEVGEQVQLRARLLPLFAPTRPGGFDYALNAYFDGLGATGFALGRARVTAGPAEAPLELRVLAAVERIRRQLTERIRAVLPGEAGAVASALVTGMRDAIPVEVNEAMRISGLAHVLAISGLHMVLVVGALFGLARGALALVPGLALRRPVKKWAAVIALAGATGYLVLSGAAVSTQRAYMMTAVVLAGVLIDRPALTVRTLATAAVVLLAATPEAILHPSFQMSFAATLALIALFERFAPLLARPPSAGAGMIARYGERVGRWILLGAMTSLAAGLATTAFAAFHFHRVAPYGLLANVLAMPVMSFAVMPAALVSVLLIPFGYDAIGWQVMGGGVELMLSIARRVAALPGAEGRVAAFGAAALLAASGGILLLTLPASRLRFAGAPLLALAMVLMTSAPPPDVLVETNGRAVAVRGADGKLSILDARRSRIAAENWLAADADGRAVGDGLAGAFTCGEERCDARLRDGATIAVVRKPEALRAACREVTLVVAALYAPRNCRAAVIDRRVLATTGAIALRRADGQWIADPVRSPIAERPWFGRAGKADAGALSRLKPPRQTHSVRSREGRDLESRFPLPPNERSEDEERDQ